MKNSLIVSQKKCFLHCFQVLYFQHFQLPLAVLKFVVSALVSRVMKRSCVFQYLDYYTSCLPPLSSARSSIQHKMNETVNSLCQDEGECAYVNRPLGQQICCSQHRETKSNVWNTFCMKLPYVAQQVENAYFYRFTKIKELSGSQWWMHEGRNLHRPVTGCGRFWHVELTGVLRH